MVNKVVGTPTEIINGVYKSRARLSKVIHEGYS